MRIDAVLGLARTRVIFLVSGLVAWGATAFAAPATEVLPEVTVTGNRNAESMSRLSNHVTVITAQDIARSTATDVGSLLALEANLSVQSFSGTDKNTTIDMRGMGATAVSNVLVLVDGERLNETDLSGADLSTLALSQIDHIDVIRGGGGVRHGQGAVGGVINIVTKRPTAGPLQLDFAARAGSYDTRGVQAAAHGGEGQVAAQVMLSHSVTDGYRDNGGLESSNVGLEVRRVTADDLGLIDLYARLQLHEDSYGLPGYVSQENFHRDDRSRRATQTPLDGGSTHDHRLTLGGAWDWGPAGRLSLRASHRERRNPYVIGADPSTIESARGLITSDRDNVQARHDLSFDIGGLTQTLTAGIDVQEGRYARYDQGVAVEGGTRISGQARTRSAFIDANIAPASSVGLHIGARQDWFRTDEAHDVYEQCVNDPTPPFAEHCAPAPYTEPDANKPSVARQWINTSAELGVHWTFAPRWTVFGSLSQHVRYPNLDELALQAETLRPQTGHTLEHGIRYGANRSLSWSLTAFAMRIEDEIYYGKNPQDPSLSENRNYEHPTLRHGLELESRWRPSERWFLRGQWAHVVPKFQHMPGNPDIPLVPRNTLSAEVSWQPVPLLQWTVEARHGSQRLDGNALDDSSSGAPPVKGHTVVNTAWRLQGKAWQLRLNINNLFDEVYTTQAYSGTVYPMPGRSAYLELRLSH
jgi:iron complex outermembrane receptor protein